MTCNIKYKNSPQSFWNFPTQPAILNVPCYIYCTFQIQTVIFFTASFVCNCTNKNIVFLKYTFYKQIPWFHRAINIRIMYRQKPHRQRMISSIKYLICVPCRKTVIIQQPYLHIMSAGKIHNDIHIMPPSFACIIRMRSGLYTERPDVAFINFQKFCL